jgi:four helix bundle protein
MSSKSYRDLRVWHAAVDLVVEVCRLTAQLPRREVFGLTAQIWRAAVSVASNIAEGQARHGSRDFMRFLVIARGSLAELDTAILIAERLGYLDAVCTIDAHTNIEGIARMLRRLEQFLHHERR